jgi:hypothetical protein
MAGNKMRGLKRSGLEEWRQAGHCLPSSLKG